MKFGKRGRRGIEKIKKYDKQIILIFIVTLFLSIGYAAISGVVFDIKGKANVNPQNGVFITDIEKIGLGNSGSDVGYYISTMMQSTVVLDKNATASETFDVTVYNGKDTEYVFIGVLTDLEDNVLYDNDDIEFSLNGLVEYETVIPPEEYLTFSITFSYKDGVVPDNNILNSKLNFRFREKPRLVVNCDTDIIENIYPDYPEQEYEFTVSNFVDDDKVNAVPINYTLMPSIDKPLKAIIYNEFGEEVTEDTVIAISSDGTKETHNYKIKIIWDNTSPEEGKDYNSIEYADKTFECKINLIGKPDDEKYLDYTLKEEEKIDVKSVPMYLNANVDNSSVVMINNIGKFILTTQNNDGQIDTENYNLIDTKYVLKTNSTKFYLKVDGELAENSELIIGSNEAIELEHTVQFFIADVYNIPKEENCELIIETISPYKYTKKIPVTIIDEGILKPTDDPADANVQMLTNYGTIEVIWLEDKTNVVTPTPNPPDLYPELGADKQMTPVSWTYHEDGIEVNGETVNWTEDAVTQTKWYDYISTGGISGRTENRISRWANAKNADGSYFVWIPRYAYRVTYYSDIDYAKVSGYYDGYGKWRAEDGKKQRELDPGVETVEYNGKNYIVHPVFINDTGKVDSEGNALEDFARGGWDDNLTGFWVGKYEVSREGATSTSQGASGSSMPFHVLPNVMSARSIKTGKFYQAGIAYDAEKQSHMIKSTEWGAVAYLTESQFGRNAFEIDSNNGTVTGSGSGSALEVLDTSFPYNTTIGAKASSTGNVYGVYDLSGGGWEYIAAFNRLAEPIRLTHTNYGGDLTKNAKDANGNYVSTKYIVTYDNASRDNRDPEIMSQLAKVGDGTKEVIAVNTSSETPLYWYHDNAVFPAYTVPYWGRGGGVGETPYSGIFYSDSTSGGAYAGVTSRFTLAK